MGIEAKCCRRPARDSIGARKGITRTQAGIRLAVQEHPDASHRRGLASVNRPLRGSSSATPSGACSKTTRKRASAARSACRAPLGVALLDTQRYSPTPTPRLAIRGGYLRQRIPACVRVPFSAYAIAQVFGFDIRSNAPRDTQTTIIIADDGAHACFFIFPVCEVSTACSSMKNVFHIENRQCVVACRQCLFNIKLLRFLSVGHHPK